MRRVNHSELFLQLKLGKCIHPFVYKHWCLLFTSTSVYAHIGMINQAASIIREASLPVFKRRLVYRRNFYTDFTDLISRIPSLERAILVI